MATETSVELHFTSLQSTVDGSNLYCLTIPSGPPPRARRESVEMLQPVYLVLHVLLLHYCSALCFSISCLETHSHKSSCVDSRQHTNHDTMPLYSTFYRSSSTRGAERTRAPQLSLSAHTPTRPPLLSLLPASRHALGPRHTISHYNRDQSEPNTLSLSLVSIERLTSFGVK